MSVTIVIVRMFGRVQKTLCFQTCGGGPSKFPIWTRVYTGRPVPTYDFILYRLTFLFELVFKVRDQGGFLGYERIFSADGGRNNYITYNKVIVIWV